MKTFVGNGFSLAIPDEWEDLTLYTLRGPEDEGHVHRIWVHVDRDPGTDEVHTFAESHLDRMIESAPGAVRLRLDPVKLASGLEGRVAEVRWAPLDDRSLYGRLTFVLHEGVGYTLSTHLTKRSRQTVGPGIDRMIEGFRPGAPPAAGAGAPAFRVGAFSIPLGDGWVDESTYVVAAPSRVGFRPNAVVTRREVGFPDEALQDLARADLAESGLAARGFEPMYEGFARTPDEGFSYRCTWRNEMPDSGAVRQDQEFLLRRGILHLLSLTTAWDRDEAQEAESRAILDGFVAAPPATAAP